MPLHVFTDFPEPQCSVTECRALVGWLPQTQHMAFVRSQLYSVCVSLCPVVCLSFTHSDKMENVKLVENIRGFLSSLMSLGSDLMAYQKVSDM